MPHQTRTGRYDDKEMSEYDLTGELTNLYDRISSYERDRYEPIEEQLIPLSISRETNVGYEKCRFGVG